ncbi:2711_t:CDS:1 [Scutellospora calospora]|uniref:2711_t:CDS:1 n=1 Tax=Scutellospora calospora TaxID=85575 RepID=A0ACA9KBD2_9GLOM|nr:2711_t:CDS:1 [Scutellospora calospora]
MNNKQILDKLYEIQKILNEMCGWKNSEKVDEILEIFKLIPELTKDETEVQKLIKDSLGKYCWEDYVDKAKDELRVIIEERELAKRIGFYLNQGKKTKNDFDIFFQNIEK